MLNSCLTHNTITNTDTAHEQEEMLYGAKLNDDADVNTNGWSQAGEDLLPNPDAEAHRDKFLSR